MATDKTHPKPKEKKEAKIASGSGSQLSKERQPDRQPPGSPADQRPEPTREVDFMDWD
jgi:hypothetical protein